MEKGFIVNWEGERVIWDKTFLGENAAVKVRDSFEYFIYRFRVILMVRIQCNPHETNLILSEAPNCPQQLQTNCDQIVFEELEFASYARCLGPYVITNEIKEEFLKQ